MGFIIQRESNNFGATEINFAIDIGGTTIQFKDYTSDAILETYPANSLSATANDIGIRIEFTGGEKVLINKLNISTIKIAGVLQTGAQADIVNALNTLFANAGGGVAPTITSSNSISLVTGASLNFTPTGTNVVAWSYDTLPTGVVSKEGQLKTIIGGSGLSAGTYNIVLRATNYHGSVTQAITLTVSAAFTNTKSWNPASGTNAYFQKTAVGSENDTPLYRAAGNTGDPWTVFGWIKNNASSTAWKPVFYFGDYASTAGGTDLGRVRFHNRLSSSHTDVELYFSYGAANITPANSVRFTGLSTGVSKNTWFSFMVVYDGGNTNTGSATSADPFSIYVNGVQLSPSWIVTDGGYGGSIEYISGFDKSQFNIARGEATNATKYANVTFFDELALWQSDQSSNVATFHNSGTPISLSAYNPYAYYRFGDGNDVTNHPIMEDIGTTGTDLTMYNGTVAQYVTDVP